MYFNKIASSWRIEICQLTFAGIGRLYHNNGSEQGGKPAKSVYNNGCCCLLLMKSFVLIRHNSH